MEKTLVGGPARFREHAQIRIIGSKKDTIKIRRGQRKTLKCGYCDETAVEIQANKRIKR